MRGIVVATVALLLSLALLGWSLMLVRAGLSRRLRERVRAAGSAAILTAAVPTPPRTLLARQRAQRRPLTLRLARLCGHRANLQRALVVPLPAVALLAVVLAALTWWRARPLVGDAVAAAATFAAGLQTARAVFAWQYRRYREALFLQIPDTIGLITRAIRSGMPLGDAIHNLATEVPSPTREEFAEVAGAVGIGQPVDSALLQLHARTGLTEYAFLAVTFGLQAQTGGSLAETLETLGDTVRKRVAMAARARALASEARTSATILVALPFVAGGALFLLRPGYLDVFFTTHAGSNLLGLGLGLVCLGVLVIRWLIRRSGAD